MCVSLYGYLTRVCLYMATLQVCVFIWLPNKRVSVYGYLTSVCLYMAT